MFDTIAIISPPLDHETSSTLEKLSTVVSKTKMDTEEKITLRRNGETPSDFGVVIFWDLLRIAGPSESMKLRLDVSIHKLLVGHNVYGGPCDIHSSVAFLVAKFEELMGIKLPPAMDWKVQRVDWAEVYQLPSKNHCEIWIKSLKDAYYPRREPERFKQSSIYISGETTTINIYHKGSWLLRKDGRKDRKRMISELREEQYSSLLSTAHCLIRVEVQIKRDKLVHDYNGENIAKNITNAYIMGVYDEEVDKFFKESSSELEKVRSADGVFNRLSAIYGAGSRLFGVLMAFWHELAFYGETMVRARTKKATFNRNLKLLRNASIQWRGTDITGAEYSIIPPDFSPVRGNKYHYNGVSPEVQEKLKPYVQRWPIIKRYPVIERHPAVAIKTATEKLGITKKHLLRLVDEGTILSFQMNGETLVIMEGAFKILLFSEQGELDFTW